jgi:alpha,alpha-trehalose phosphorylase
MLEPARQRARELNQKGALFPWRTINGEEASAYYAAGTAQYHINADIMYALKKYVNATGDRDFLKECGAEMLIETARLWHDLGFYSDSGEGNFCIHGVTGPDEYTTVVNNNTYTNLMARENLRYAAETVEALRAEEPEAYEALVHKTGLNPKEVVDWKAAAERMYVPYDEERGIHPQDDTFLEREVWDFEHTPPDKYPLLLHYHPLVIYRFQVIKQTDVVLAMFMCGNDFSREEMKANFDYYEPLTTGDSSLSICIESIMASAVGYKNKAFEYARDAVLIDLGNIGGNVRDGCHIAAMGGTWMVFVNGFAGMRDYDGHLSFNPCLPEPLTRVRFPLMVKGQHLVVEVTPTETTYLLKEGDGLTITHRGKEITLKQGESQTLPQEC